MWELIELADLDLRYEVCSLGDPAREKRLQISILERGIRELLLGIDGDDAKILLDGFKRLRCAENPHIGIAPLALHGNRRARGDSRADEACGRPVPSTASI